MDEQVRGPPAREAEVLEAAAELAAVCAAMKDGGGVRCFLHSAGSENRRSLRPELGTGE